jgi:predicted DNA-binding protein
MPVNFVQKKQPEAIKKPFGQNGDGRISTYLNEDMYAQIIEISERTGASKTEILRRAVKAYLENLKK